MSIMSLLSIEKTREECFVLVGGVTCFGVIARSSSPITGCRLDRWEDLIEYIVWVTGIYFFDSFFSLIFFLN